MKVKFNNGAMKRIFVFAIVAGFAIFAHPAYAFAAEDSGGIAMLIPNMLEWIPMLIGFIVLWFVLAKFAWPMITGMLDKRITTIQGSLDAAESAKIESERLLEEYRVQLDDAKRHAAQIVAEAKQAAEVVKADITAKAQEEAESMIAKARMVIETEKKVAIAELQATFADRSISVASRLIGQDLSDTEHRKIIEHYLAEAGTLDAN